MKLTPWIRVVLLGLITSTSALANAEKFNFKTPFDHFELNVGTRGATFEGKTVDIAPYQEGLNAILNPLGNDCPTLSGSPDITVKVGSQTRLVYVQQGVVTDGKTCVLVGGDGLYYLPVHRDFLIGPKRDSIHLQSPLKVFRQGVKLLSLKKVHKEWVNETPNQLLDWDFLERFENNLSDFSVTLRVQLGLAKDKPKMILQSGNQSFEFYKLTEKMWAVKKPGAKWLEASDDWSTWYDFDAKLLEDRHSNEIKLIEDPTKDKQSRLDALAAVEATWSPNLRELYHKLLNRADEDTTLQDIALKRLKRKPSIETAGVLIHFLETSDNADLKRQAGRILKLQNPKGPKYDPNGSEESKAKTMESWRKWWEKNQKGS